MLSIKKIENIMLYYCLFYLCTFYLFDVLIGMIFKYIFFACLIYGIIGYFFSKLLIKSKNINTVFILGVVVFLVFTFQCFNVKDSEQMIRGIYQYPFYLLIIPSTSYMIKNTNIDKMLKWLTRYGVLLSVCALYEQITQHYIVGVGIGECFYETLFVDNNFGGAIRAAVFSGSPLVFGMLMAILTVISFYYFWQSKNLPNSVVLSANFVGLVSSFSRAPLVFTLISISFMYLYSGNNNRLKHLYRYKIVKYVLCIFLACIVLFFLGIFFDKVDYIIQRYFSIFDWSSNQSNVTRFLIWQDVINRILEWDVILFGNGPGFTSGAIGLVTESGVLKRILELGIFSCFLYYLFLYKCIKKGILIGRYTGNRYYVLCISVILCILLEDVILQITESISITFFMSLFISLLYHNPKVSN